MPLDHLSPHGGISITADRVSSITRNVIPAITTQEPIKSERELFHQFHIVSLDFLAIVHASNLFERCPDIWIFVDQRQVLRLGPHSSATSHPLPYVLGCFHGAIRVFVLRMHVMKDDTLFTRQMDNDILSRDLSRGSSGNFAR
jgi:hypothetical protein